MIQTTNGVKAERLTRKELADRWGVCTETIKRMQHKGALPAIIFNGRNVRYRLEDIESVEQRNLTRLAKGICEN